MVFPKMPEHPPVGDLDRFLETAAIRGSFVVHRADLEAASAQSEQLAAQRTEAVVFAMQHAHTCDTLRDIRDLHATVAYTGFGREELHKDPRKKNQLELVTGVSVIFGIQPGNHGDELKRVLLVDCVLDNSLSAAQQKQIIEAYDSTPFKAHYPLTARGLTVGVYRRLKAAHKRAQRKHFVSWFNGKSDPSLAQASQALQQSRTQAREFISTHWPGFKDSLKTRITGS